MSPKSKKRQAFQGIACPHIGAILKKHVRDNKVSQASWARKQGVKDESVIRYFKKSTMQISTVFDICQILDFNVFKIIAQALPSEMPPPEVNELLEDNAKLKADNEKLKFHIEILEKMMKK